MIYQNDKNENTKINFFQRFKRTSVIVQGLAGLERTDGVD